MSIAVSLEGSFGHLGAQLSDSCRDLGMRSEGRRRLVDGFTSPAGGIACLDIQISEELRRLARQGGAGDELGVLLLEPCESVSSHRGIIAGRVK